jgi:hypothetical protein
LRGRRIKDRYLRLFCSSESIFLIEFSKIIPVVMPAGIIENCLKMSVFEVFYDEDIIWFGDY